jgi:NAD(P)-dependent dehydrogenase (short-subunit alcohol dehydrogenase family)
MNLTGTVALVTGANRGIGAAIVQALLESGVRRVYAGVRSLPVEAPKDARIVPVLLDITDDARLAEVASTLGDVSILVNNAGISLGQPLLAARDPEAAAQEMRVNYFGTLAVVRAFAPVLEANGGGAIVNVLSILGRVNLPAVGSYSASKAAAFSLTQGIRAELAAKGTLVVGVMPGFVDTDMAAGVRQPKMTPAAVATEIVGALQLGIEDVYPGPASEIAAGLVRDPKGVERSFAGRLGG